MKKNIAIGNGIISIFLIFICLCLTCFCVLAFLSASMDKKYTNKRTEETDKYYEADSKARVILKDVDEMVTSLVENNFPVELIVESVSEIEGVKASNVGNDIKVEYSVEIDEYKSIGVSLVFDKDGKYQVTSWNTHTTSGEMITDEPLNLWVGN